MTDKTTPQASQEIVATPSSTRRKRLLVVFGAIAVAASAFAAWRFFSDDSLRSTDNAYVGGQVVQVMPQIAGTVTRIMADNTDRIAAGASLIQLDSTDAQVELAAAEAKLAQAVRTVRGLYANDARYGADILAQQAELDKARADLAERKAVASIGAVTGEDLRHAANAVLKAEAIYTAAQQARAQALAQIDGSTFASHPDIQAAAQRVRAALIALSRSRIVAPVSGMVAQRVVQLGRRVGPGDRLMSIVPLDRLWVDANFKEVQLKGICPGQSAKVTADVYGKALIYHGRVEDIEAATGAAVALLPAQNATGNWIKIVQRVPVRISLDPAELLRNPLRIGMSTEVEINTSSCDAQWAAARKPKDDNAAGLYDVQAGIAETRVKEIIAENMGSHK
ncbi:efflux RND transporter periplasmic adaptor subunit [Solimicrobium silvestre]|uniref:Multidrug resistance efflux pump n=1 Tax=Solimicrobium silvestre TaxID=2099400 RepID=A0A2S9H271_9BURK|nr:efflux RND transporter periplasmic adaptor subunit [Solimicrobium silvestre]PRC94085.1 Multidrug resistance efflux pump [Solimicrobium silvestre]